MRSKVETFQGPSWHTPATVSLVASGCRWELLSPVCLRAPAFFLIKKKEKTAERFMFLAPKLVCGFRYLLFHITAVWLTWGISYEGYRAEAWGGSWGLDDGCDLNSMNHVWIINHSLDSNQVLNSCGVNYLPALFVFCFVFLLSFACKAANRWREDGMWGQCCDWPGKGHAHHVSPCGKSGYVLTP